jgi:hypothetical protein
MEEHNRNTVPLYAARLSDLTHASEVTVTCRCGHVAAVSVESLWNRLPLWMKVTDLPEWLRCRSCDARGSVEVDAREALGYGQANGGALSQA